MAFKFLSEWGDECSVQINRTLAQTVKVPLFQFNQIESVFLQMHDFDCGVSGRAFSLMQKQVEATVGKLSPTQ